MPDGYTLKVCKEIVRLGAHVKYDTVPRYGKVTATFVSRISVPFPVPQHGFLLEKGTGKRCGDTVIKMNGIFL